MTAKPRILPPVYFLGAIVLIALLHGLAPVVRFDLPIARVFGGLLVAGGLFFTVWGAGIFRRRGTAIKPFERSQVLVIEGPYRVSRNPMYAGLVAVLAGLVLLLQSLSAVVVPILFAWLLHRRFVRPEERMLEERFGDAYAEYRRRVRRWL
ncbi:MAG TPA: isoprenylcysteine carboxylmethyltransferase family protein [Casimicrobiaceae bacterium]|nr:isoprenylcysteine carboxylmethyltransferase family protein [Casimicrobiaceae bacterium]